MKKFVKKYIKWVYDRKFFDVSKTKEYFDLAFFASLFGDGRKISITLVVAFLVNGFVELEKVNYFMLKFLALFSIWVFFVLIENIYLKKKNAKERS